MRRGNAVIAMRRAQRDLQNGLAYTLRVTVNGTRTRWMGIGSPELLSRLCQNAPFYLSAGGRADFESGARSDCVQAGTRREHTRLL